MPTKRTLAQRGYKQVVLNSAVAEALAGFCAANGGLSASAAVAKLLDGGCSSGGKNVSIHQDDLELLIRMARIGPAEAQRLREARELM